MAVRDTLRIYDEAVVTWAKKVITHPNIDLRDRIVFSSPERPFGFDLGNADNPEGNVDTARAVHTLTTPRISVTRLSLGFAANRNNTTTVNVRPWSPDCYFTVQAPFPRPWDIPYQIDILCRYRQDANWAIRWFLHNPNPTWQIIIDFGYPWGQKAISFVFNDIIDNSELETEERERWIRHTISMTVEAYLFESFDNSSDLMNSDAMATRLIRNAHQILTDIYVQHNDGQFPEPIPVEDEPTEDIIHIVVDKKD